MIERLQIVTTEETSPYINLALEEYLLTNVEENTCVLYLWQNSNTVVVGRNQDVFRECSVEQAEKDGVRIARRLSGGGAVFHDMGNLNFTFLCRKIDRDIAGNTDIILDALKRLGIDAERSGRNDILACGAKVSGNAFYETGGCCYHHGTLLIDADKGLIERYLSVSKDKLALKGVASVRSRVTNLKDIKSDVSVDSVKDSLIKSFSARYGLDPEIRKGEDIPEKELREGIRRFRSRRWIFGEKIFCNRRMSRRFRWGEIELLLNVEDGVIRQAHVFSDAMDQEHILRIAEALNGSGYDEDSVMQALRRAVGGSAAQREASDVNEDIMLMVREYMKEQERSDE